MCDIHGVVVLQCCKVLSKVAFLIPTCPWFTYSSLWVTVLTTLGGLDGSTGESFKGARIDVKSWGHREQSVGNQTSKLKVWTNENLESFMMDWHFRKLHFTVYCGGYGYISWTIPVPIAILGVIVISIVHDFTRPLMNHEPPSKSIWLIQ